MAEEFEGVAYPTLEDALDAFAMLFGCTRDVGRDQLLRPEALESALKRPQMHAHYQRADLALQAAVLAHGVAETQAFIDGNKRTAELVMLFFLDANGYALETSDEDEEDLAAWIIDLSEHVSLEGFADWIRERLTPATQDAG